MHLENTQAKKKELKLIYYIKPVLNEDEIKSRGFLKIQYKENSNLVTLENTGKNTKDTILYVSCSEKIKSYTGDKNSFIGNGNITKPDAINSIELDRQDSLGKDPIIGIELRVSLEAFERKDIVLGLGAETSLIECQDKAYQYAQMNPL